ncbi:MAG: phosphatidate cytidylyltransferase [Thiobacillaceae bacterium]
MVSRIITASVLLVFILPALFWAPAEIWASLAALAIAIAGIEWGRIAGFPAPVPVVYGVLLAACAAVLYFQANHKELIHGLLWLAVAFWALVVPIWLAQHWKIRSPFVLAMVGAIVLLPTWVALVRLRDLGPWHLLGLLAIVWIADSAAYFSGRKFGSRKLAPSISPGKTWEGVAGATVALVVYACVASAFIAGVHIVGALLLAMSLLYFSILGDLFESWMKRVAGIKDSGTILPGHGGILDRIDALTAALPIGVAILLIAGGHL